jgi:hypothetical protein
MSLILDALNRARGEPADGRAVPGLDSQHFPPVEPAVGWRQWLLPASLVLALLVIAGLLWRQFAVTSPVAAPVQAQAPMPLIPAPPSAAPPSVAVAPVAKTEVRTDAVAERLQPAPSPEVAALYRREMSVPDTGEDSPAVADRVAVDTGIDTDADNNEAGNGASDDVAADIGSLVSAAEQALQDVRLSQHPVSFLAALSQQRKDAIPTLMYLQHDYRGDGGSRVTINGTEAAVGEPVGRGVTVEEILPDSVVLSHDGQQFRLRALNSWVNL